MFDQAQRLRELTGVSGRAANSPTPVISVTSGKGGTGKSFLSFYLAQFLAQQGYKTLLIECDFNLSALSIHLDLTPTSTIYDLFAGNELFDNIPLQVADNFSILFGDNGKLDFPENRLGHIRNLFNTLYDRSHKYDFILLDNGAGIGSEVMEIIRNSTMNLLVSLQDTVAVMDAYVVVKMMLKNSIQIPQGVIINKCRTVDEGKTAFNNLNSATSHFFETEMQLVGVVEEDRELNDVKLISDEISELVDSTPLFTQIHAAANQIKSFSQLANNHQPL